MVFKVQIHHQFRNGFTELCSQREVEGYADIDALFNETKITHPLPDGAEWLCCTESSPYFKVSADMVDIGVVINLDTRPGYTDKTAYCGMYGGGGCRSVDFFTDNVLNKIRFFRGYKIEVTLYVHMVEDITDEVWESLKKMMDDGLVHNLAFNRDTRVFMGGPIRQFHDTMYLNAMMLSRAKYIAHFDADSAAYRRDECDIIDQIINWVESGQYDIVSYPTVHSPMEGPNQCLPGDPEYLWASTRFFFCKREFLNYNEFVKFFDDAYWIERHEGKPHRYPNVTEQILGFMAGPERVFYPPKNLDDFMIFCWHRYNKGTIGILNELSYDEVYDFVINQCGGIGGACDVSDID